MQQRSFPAIATGLALLAVVVVFFPTLFFGRVVSPWDVVLNDPPWRAVHHPVEVTNPELEEPATAFLPLMLEARRDGLATAVWSPYLAGGVPGTLMWSTGLLSPFVLPFLPWLSPILYGNVLILGKLLAAFLGTYLLLRRRGSDEAPAAVGATVYALAACLAAQWLWPSSAATALLPLLLWAVDRTLDAPIPLRRGVVVALAWLAFLASGAPAPSVVGCYAVAAWIAYRLLSATAPRRADVLRATTVVAAGFLAAVLLLTPSLALFTRFLGPSGALAKPPPHGGWGARTAHMLVDLYAFGDPRHDTWAPPEALRGASFHQAALAMGWVALALAALGVAARRRDTWAWVAAVAGVLAALAFHPVGRAIALLPLMKPVATWRLIPLLALGVAALAAAGAGALGRLAGPRWGRPLLLVLGIAVVLEQGMVAGHLLPYLRPRDAQLSTTAGIRYLAERIAVAPTRVAPLQDVLWPDTATAFGIEDLRSQFASTAEYRRWLQVVDPQVWGHFGRLLRLNAATVDYLHPYLAALGARFVLEPPHLRLVEYGLGQKTIEVEPRSATLGPLAPGDAVVQELDLPRGCSRIGVHATVSTTGAGEALHIILADEVTDHRAGHWSLSADRLARDGMGWLDLPSGVTSGHRLRLILRVGRGGAQLRLRTTPNADALPGRLSRNGHLVAADLALSFDTSGYVLAYEGDDLRIWENRRAAPRFYPVRTLLPGGLDTLLDAEPPLDLARVAVVSAQDAARLTPTLATPPTGAAERVALTGWSPGAYALHVKLATPALLVSSLQRTARLWRATVDGQPRPLITVNGLFVGLPLTAGSHRVTVTARLPVLWYAASAAGLVALVALACVALAPRRTPGGMAE